MSTAHARGQAFALALTLVSASAFADQAPVPVTLVIDRTDAPRLGSRVRAAMQSYFERDPRLTVRIVDIGLDLGTPFGPAAEAALTAARKFREMDLDDAKTEVEKAIAVYEQHIEALAALDTGVRPLRDAYILLGKIRFFESNFDGAKDALRRAFVLDPKLQYNAQQFPSQMRRVVIEARLWFDTMHAGRIAVTSEPAGASVWVNGRQSGAHTPATVEVPAGPNTVGVHLLGYQVAQKLAEVNGDGKSEAKVSVTLSRLTGDDRMHEITVAMALGRPNTTDLDALAQSMASEALLLVHVAAASEMRFRLTGGVFVRPRPATGKKGRVSDEEKLLIEPRLERGGVPPTLEGECEIMARALAEHLADKAAPKVVAQVEPTENDSNGKMQQLRRSRAFWWVIGGVGGVVVAGVAIGLGVGLAHQQQLGRETVLLGGH